MYEQADKFFVGYLGGSIRLDALCPQVKGKVYAPSWQEIPAKACRAGMKLRVRNPNMGGGLWEEIVVKKTKAVSSHGGGAGADVGERDGLTERRKTAAPGGSGGYYERSLEDVKKHYSQIEHRARRVDLVFSSGAAPGGAAARPPRGAAAAVHTTTPTFVLKLIVDADERSMRGKFALQGRPFQGSAHATRKHVGAFIDSDQEEWDPEGPLIESLDRFIVHTHFAGLAHEREMCSILRGDYTHSLKRAAFVCADPCLHVAMTRYLVQNRVWAWRPRSDKLQGEVLADEKHNAVPSEYLALAILNLGCYAEQLEHNSPCHFKHFFRDTAGPHNIPLLTLSKEVRDGLLFEKIFSRAGTVLSGKEDEDPASSSKGSEDMVQLLEKAFLRSALRSEEPSRGGPGQPQLMSML